MSAMRKFPVLLATSLLAMAFAPAAHARQTDHAVATGHALPEAGVAADTGAGTGATVDAGADAEPQQAAETSRSGFGQVMSVLTGLLQDAAQREATGRGDGFALDNPAIEISVTPVEGQTSLLRTPAGRDAAGERRSGAREPQLAAGTPR
jgi:hypothetical protein